MATTRWEVMPRRAGPCWRTVHGPRIPLLCVDSVHCLYRKPSATQLRTVHSSPMSPFLAPWTVNLVK